MPNSLIKKLTETVHQKRRRRQSWIVRVLNFPLCLLHQLEHHVVVAGNKVANFFKAADLLINAFAIGQVAAVAGGRIAPSGGARGDDGKGERLQRQQSLNRIFNRRQLAGRKSNDHAHVRRKQADDAADPARRRLTVRIRQHNNFSARLLNAVVDGIFFRRENRVAILSAQQADSSILYGVNNRCGSVRGLVINDEDLIVVTAIILLQESAEQAGNIFLFIARRNDN